ncbi:hypothetical protein TIFTF001_046915 [Ficus carica]|uniref:Uncharacterized protein n=1 Tax=Ficus carica TaxID=3494 RepID=A0AA88CJY9_FICCA|nr:hypothetical protein TIFTF001_046907 [Ficus carica]GMN19106.1 hypothetical protein TIFTF001_046910 [Ficus carica]GMN19122.1 hypothetical protein TIFTF001_046912 [Ficus carica]GMN19137.1 hypothetical protein TIFTF001_046915 [Ficus carica]
MGSRRWTHCAKPCVYHYIKSHRHPPPPALTGATPAGAGGKPP